MRTLHLYLTRQMLATLSMTVFVFTLVLLLANGIREPLQLVIRREVTIWVFLHAIWLLVPYVLAFSLPIGMLTAALLVFGRFSADQELTAARASGISLVSLISPVLLLSVVVSGLCLWLNCDVAPASRMAYKELLYQAGVSRPSDFLQSGESTPIGGQTIFVGKRHADGTNFDNIILLKYDNKTGQLEQVIQGSSGTIVSDPVNKQIVLNLNNQHGMQLHRNGWEPIAENGRVNNYSIPITEAQEHKVVQLPISDMTFRQLLDKRAEIERAMAEAPAKGLGDAQLFEMQRQLRQITNDQTSPVLVYMHRAAAFSCACIGFTLVGIPLGIRSHRRETSIGVATALLLMLIYYSFIVLGQAWADHAERAPYLIVWLPNFIFQAVGAVLLWKANRGV